MTEVFTSLKAEVRPVSDTEEAASIVNREKFDGIFLDLEMPRLSGFDLAQLIRRSSWNRSTPIVIVTGRDARQTMQDSFALGATFFIQKPVDRQKLSALFRTVSGGMLENRRKYTRVPIKADVTCAVGPQDDAGSELEPEPGRDASGGWRPTCERCGEIVISIAGIRRGP